MGKEQVVDFQSWYCHHLYQRERIPIERWHPSRRRSVICKLWILPIKTSKIETRWCSSGVMVSSLSGSDKKTECGAQVLVGTVKVGELVVNVDRDGVGIMMV